MSAGVGVCDCDIGDPIDGELVVQAAIIAEDAAVTVRCVFAETDVGDDEELWESLSEESDAGHDWALWIVGGGPESIFGAWCDWDTEEDDGLQSLAHERFEEWDKPVDTAAVLVWEGGNDGLLVVLVGNKERIDEHRLWQESAIALVASSPNDPS